MGYVLYTASGTFNPASYGLSPGDALNLVVVGGGGQAMRVIKTVTQR